MSARDVLICFSHERWGDPSRTLEPRLADAAKERRVFFVEEPEYDRDKPQLRGWVTACGVIVLRPVVPAGTADDDITAQVLELLSSFLRFARVERFDVITSEDLQPAAAAA